MAVPRVDLFSTYHNWKCRQFCSRTGHNPGSLTDAFLLPWRTDYVCICSSSTHPQSIIKNQAGSCSYNPHSTGVAMLTLVLHSAEPPNLGFVDITCRTKPELSELVTSFIPTSDSSSCSMDAPWKVLQEVCPRNVQNALLNIRKPSTMYIYLWSESSSSCGLSRKVFFHSGMLYSIFWTICYHWNIKIFPSVPSEFT